MWPYESSVGGAAPLKGPLGSMSIKSIKINCFLSKISKDGILDNIQIFEFFCHLENVVAIGINGNYGRISGECGEAIPPNQIH